MEKKSLFRFQICPCSWPVAVATHSACQHNSVFPGCCSLRTCMPSPSCDALTLKCLGPGEMGLSACLGACLTKAVACHASPFSLTQSTQPENEYKKDSMITTHTHMQNTCSQFQWVYRPVFFQKQTLDEVSTANSLLGS